MGGGEEIGFAIGSSSGRGRRESAVDDDSRSPSHRNRGLVLAAVDWKRAERRDNDTALRNMTDLELCIKQKDQYQFVGHCRTSVVTTFNCFDTGDSSGPAKRLGSDGSPV